MKTQENSYDSCIKSINFAKKDTSKLPRTWGREWFLIRDKEIQKKLTAYDDIKLFPVSLLCILLCLATGILSFIRLDGMEVIFLSSFCAVFLTFVTLMLSWLLKSVHRDILRPTYFSRLVKKSCENCDGKLETFKKIFPEPKYRVASLPPFIDAKQVRVLLEADHPLSRKARAEAEAILEAQKELEEAQEHAELAEAKAKPPPS